MKTTKPARQSLQVLCCRGGHGGGSPREKGAGGVREAEDRLRRRGGWKRDSQGGGKPKKKGKIMQHCAIFRNRKNAKKRETTNTGPEPGLKGTGTGIKGYGKREVYTPLSPPTFPHLLNWPEQQIVVN